MIALTSPADFLASGYEVPELDQNTPEWLEFRKQHRTASETPIVMGLSPFTTREQLAATKWGAAVNKENPATRHGHNHEQTARAYFELKSSKSFPAMVLKRGLWLASVDGFDPKANELLEIKCPFSGRKGHTWQAAAAGRVPDHYYAQIQHQLLVSGATLCNFWVYDSATEQGLHVPVLPNREWWPVIERWWNWFEEYFKPSKPK